MRTLAPGKLILSGEHAVVHGAPALAVAVNRYAQASVTQREGKEILFELLDIDFYKSYEISTLEALKQRLQSSYQRFIGGEWRIRHVLKQPAELSQFLLMEMFEQLKIPLREGIALKVQSSIPIGCGMGSSAAIIISLLHALISELILEVDEAEYLSIGKRTEQLQHGYSSGLDLHLSLLGGCQWYDRGELRRENLSVMDFLCVHTGVPASSTGECVEYTQRAFSDKGLTAAFKQATHEVHQALQNHSTAALLESVKNNHQLLRRIGVVPEKVNQFIAAVEQASGAAKICGAGAIAGHCGGIVWLVGVDEAALCNLCKEWGFQPMVLRGEQNGVRTL